ncbi:glycoside hydrolase family 88 protein [Persicobacter psychrovividus]|uniref:Glucuronyl hydrolase n=1 Tax=Persicobacter psychrovividus TaxID=387638 RepID=A0ABM7VJS7_9BACT|nr:glucuronyl hydrolase [Persicobacter psychrovividus]
MRYFITYFSIILLLISCSQERRTAQSPTFSTQKAKQAIAQCALQYEGMVKQMPPAQFPRSFEGGKMINSDKFWWCSGFYPGTLWYLYEATKDEKWKALATAKTLELDSVKNETRHHDLGFMLFCSYGNAYKITKNEKFLEPLITGAYTLAKRFNPNVGAIKSWDWDGRRGWKYPVIIDNMMNLELLTWVGEREGQSSSLLKIANEHAQTTIKHHFRQDYSSYHVIDYNPENGSVLHKNTAQGLSDESSWARGQAWGLYGYTMMYRYTKNRVYLEQAKHIAGFILSNPNYPADGVPYWDFNDPKIPNTYRDASAGAVMASAFIDLSQFTKDETLGKQYFDQASTILNTLSSNQYLAKVGENGHFLLKHSVGNLPRNSEVDTPLSYADYYYVEALVKYLETQKAI